MLKFNNVTNLSTLSLPLLEVNLMGATSVTGTGHGSADGMNKGSEHMTLGVSHLIGTRVVRAGRLTLAGGTGTVEFPPLPGVATDYIPIAMSLSGANPVGKTGFDVNYLTVVGTGTDSVAFIIVKL